MTPRSSEDRRLKQANEELAVFQIFLKAFPSFACEVEHFDRPAADFPDIVVRLTNHREIDFELGEWLDGAQMQQAKRVEQLETRILEAIGEQQANISNHFRFVMLTLWEGAPRFDPRDRDALRAEIDRLVRTVEERWPSQRHWQSPQGYLCKNFGGYPTLAKYLMSAHFDPLRFGLEAGKPWPTGQPWIVFESPGGSYSAADALCALLAILEKKAGHYGEFAKRPARLLIHYGQGLRYNTPYREIECRSFADVARIVAEKLAGIPSPFKQVYLLDAVEPEPQVFEIYPTLVQRI